MRRYEVRSNPFDITQGYPERSRTDKRLKVKALYHLDLYRLEENIEQEVRNLGIEEIWKDPENLVVIEWAEKIKNVIPADATWIKFENIGDNKLSRTKVRGIPQAGEFVSRFARNKRRIIVK